MGEYLRLQSSQPITDCGRKYNTIYFICGIGGGVIMAVMSSSPFAAFCMGVILGLIVGLAIKNGILMFSVEKLRQTKFALESKPAYRDLITQLNQTLTPMGMHIEAASDGSPSITYDGMIYDVRYDSSRDFFTIWWRKNVARAIINGGNNISIYRKASVAMGIIGYYVQQACNGNSSSQIINDNRNNVVSNNTSEVDIKFCTKCGNKYKVGTRFCPKCGNGLE